MNFKDKNWFKDIPITLNAHTWFILYGNVFLALKHPDNKGICRTLAEDFLTRVETMLLNESLLTPDDISIFHNKDY